MALAKDVKPPKADRRKINWSKVRGPKAWIALIVGTAGGAGLMPKMPGTMGTLVGVPCALMTRGWPTEFRLLFWAALLAAGTWAARVFDEKMGTSDHQAIVMDEVVGYGISAWTVGNGLPAILAAFALFRFFDIVKPWPIRWIDRSSKDWGNPWAQAFGVMLDDILAAFMALACLVALQATGWLS